MLLFYLFFLGFISSNYVSTALRQIGEAESRPNAPTWIVVDSQTNTSCIIFDGILEFIVDYDTSDGMESTAHVFVPPGALVAGSCGSDIQTLNLTWGSPPNIATFVFTKNSSNGGDISVFSGYYQLQSISAEIVTNPIQFFNAALPEKSYPVEASNDLGFMSAPLDLSYFCRSNQYVEFNDTSVLLKLSHIQTEAFNDDPIYGAGNDFGPRSYCTADSFNMVITVLLYICIMTFIGMTIMYIVQRKYKRAGYIRHK